MGLKVKFVSAIIDAFSNKKKWGSIFFCKKNQTRGGGAREVWLKTILLPHFFLHPSLSLMVLNLKYIILSGDVRLAEPFPSHTMQYEKDDLQFHFAPLGESSKCLYCNLLQGRKKATVAFS